MWIDTHAHLYNKQPEELSTILSTAHAAQVNAIINTSVDLATARTILAQCDQNSTLFAALGISPFDVTNCITAWQQTLSGLLTHKAVVAIGETGLDNSNPKYPTIKQQLPFFEGHLELAKEYDLPVIMHSRGSELVVLDLCTRAGIERAIFHCYTGTIDVAKKIVAAGYYISFSGIITFKNSTFSDLINMVPLNQLVIETDTPYLAPVPYRGQTNQPAYIAAVGEAVARIKNITIQELSSALHDNFNTLFRRNIVDHVP